MRSSRPTVVFCAAAGPRLGFGHLLRSRALARALHVPFVVALRGRPQARRAARALGAVVIPPTAASLATLAPALVVIDDPDAAIASRWVGRARRLGIRAASLHDAGLGYVASDLVIDGSFAAPAGAADCSGPKFAVLDPAFAAHRAARGARAAGRVLIALGGGAHVRRFGASLAASVAAAVPTAQIDIAPGFAAGPRPPLPASARWLDGPQAFADALARCAVAVLAGGVTLYEACALGAPAVAVAVVRAQRPAIAAAAARGAVIDGGMAGGRRAARGIATRVAAVLAQPVLAGRLARHARAAIDGRGAARVAAILRSRALRTRGGAHAA